MHLLEKLDLAISNCVSGESVSVEFTYDELQTIRKMVVLSAYEDRLSND
ncbi:hypothetical protein [Virgibacillus salexigens]|uniref:Uncharacterized protein n=1 Tax=Virgibacillus massiliensis TaxID=1462526 RepID=A0A024QH09_9BACI|nr:hypothetical protein [Virgibacillus massiliensis]CDQ41853.1 hypothetical protein BN990_04232 [Virgibacillus massiliensis]